VRVFTPFSSRISSIRISPWILTVANKTFIKNGFIASKPNLFDITFLRDSKEKFFLDVEGDSLVTSFSLS
jgi:hypothetical protein